MILIYPMEKGLKFSEKAESKAVNESSYKKLVGILTYLTATRPDLSYPDNYLLNYTGSNKLNNGQQQRGCYNM